MYLKIRIWMNKSCLAKLVKAVTWAWAWAYILSWKRARVFIFIYLFNELVVAKTYYCKTTSKESNTIHMYGKFFRDHPSYFDKHVSNLTN